MTDSGMNEIFGDTEAPADVAQATPEPGDTTAPVAVEAESAVDESGVQAPTTQDQRMVPLPALQEERKKRQELAHRLGQMEQYLQGMQVGANAASSPEKPAVDDDDKIFEDIPGAIRGIEARMENRFVEAMRQERYAMSEATAQDMYDDYNEAIQAYVEIATESPHIAAEVDAHRAPAMRAYKLGKKHLKAKNSKTMTESEIEAEVQRRLSEQLTAAQKGAAAGLPRSLAGARGTGAGAAGSQAVGTSSLEDIFKR